MYENQYPDMYPQNRDNGEEQAELNQNQNQNQVQGRFSEQIWQDMSQDAGTDMGGNSTYDTSVRTEVNTTSELNTETETNSSSSIYSGADINANTNTNANTNINQANHYYHNMNTGYNGAGTWQHNNSYARSAGSYQYGNTYPNDYANLHNEVKKEKEKKEKSGNGYFKKVLVCVSLGLFFGICAGLGFYAVEAATGMLNRDSQAQISEVPREVGDSAKAGIEKGKEEVISGSVTHGSDGSMIHKTNTVTTVVSDVSDVVSAVMPAAVSISNTYTETMSYFGQALTNEAEASGSGIIVGENDTELLIVTNYHVIESANKLSVQFVDGSEAEASVKGTDADMDLAVIAVPLTDISSTSLEQIAIATLGDSDTLKIGEPAIAIGNSLGYGQSVTTGVISALNREMELSDGSTGTFIQTDAAINPGNSGGALLNINGEVIGINSNKIGGSVIEGMGYAIPISAASPIIADLMLRETRNKVAEDERGFLGISGISVTAEVSSAYGMPKGVYIAQVYEGTAAAAAGLKKGDIITAFDGAGVSSMDELQRLLEYYAKGDTAEITIMTVSNDGYVSKTVDITLGNKVEQ